MNNIISHQPSPNALKQDRRLLPGGFETGATIQCLKKKKKSQFSKFLFNPRKIPRGGWGLRPSSKTTDIWVRPWDLGFGLATSPWGL